MSDVITAFAPASIANFGPGYGAFGLALDALGDRVSARVLPNEDVVRIVEIRADDGLLPVEAAKNTAGLAVMALREQLGKVAGVELLLCKGVPASSGLGSSAASAVAAVVAANAVLGRRLKKPELLAAACAGEVASAGVAHGDNAAASLLGGAVIYDAQGPLLLPVPTNLWLCVVWPGFAIPTVDSLAVLPDLLPRGDVVYNLANLARLVDAFHRGDAAAIGGALRDKLSEPYRLKLIPGGELLREAACSEGATGWSICGSGPAVVASASSHAAVCAASKAMCKVLENAGQRPQAWVLRPDSHGAHLLPPAEVIPFPDAL